MIDWGKNQKVWQKFGNFEKKKCENLEKILVFGRSLEIWGETLDIWKKIRKFEKQEGAKLCQAQPAQHKLFGFNGAIFFGVNC